MHTLLILNPGHFHAALVLREAHPRLSDNIYVYSQTGPDLDRFLEIVDAFNTRPTNPTHWKIHLYTEADYLDKLIEEKKGDIVILAGMNNTKMKNIEILNREGFAILADKPWVTSEEALPFLRSAMAADRPLTMDIMTERYEITMRLQKELLSSEEVFGQIRVDDDGSPSVFKESVHHLYKIVNDKPLVRPIWYFDVIVQGEGLVDTTVHLVDMTHWMLFPAKPIEYSKDIKLMDARRWPTKVPLEKFSKITGAADFPDPVQDDVKGDILDYYCNGEVFYRVMGIPVHLREIWNLEIPEGGGDTHRSIVKGTRTDLIIRQLPARGFKTELLLVPHGDREQMGQAVRAYLQKLSNKYPGLGMTQEENALLIDIPDRLRTTHEQHFCKVRDAFLEKLDEGIIPAGDRTNIITKYTLLAEARKMALSSPFEMLRHDL
jgi:predicted dehydrogenase